MANAVTAQPPTKKPTTPKQPTKNEINAGMQEIIADLKKQIAEQEKQVAEAKKNKEDAETIKEMEDGLEMLKKQLSSIQNVSKSTSLVSDEAFEEAMKEKEEGVPKRDDIRIKSLPQKVLTDAELFVFIKNVHAGVEKNISPQQKEVAALIYNNAIANKQSPSSIGTLASLYWMNDYHEIALFLLGKACMSEKQDPDNMNNYAAFLAQTGGEQLALPILEKLNTQYPGNSTVLNNIGQAWYGLGEMSNANLYLDACMSVYADHSEANLTKAIIQKSEGKTQEAIESLKRSIKRNYSSEKETMLEELGEKLEYHEVPFPYPIKKDALGLEKFTGMIPDYPLTLGDADINNEKWKEFGKAIRKVDEKMQPEAEQKKSKMSDFLLRTQGDATIMQPYNNQIWKRALKKLKLLDDWFMGEIEMLTRKQIAVQDSADAWYKAYYDIAAKHPGCAVLNAAAVDYMSKSNSLLKPLNHQRVVAIKYYTEQAANLYMYISTDQSVYDFMIISLKASFLAQLGSLDYRWMSTCHEGSNQQTIPGMTLPDFDELNCEYKTELSIPKVFSIKVECNKMTTSFDLPLVKGTVVENLNTKKAFDIIKGSVEISQGFSKDIPLRGPLSAEMKMEVGAFIEFDKAGITDVGIKGDLSATVSTSNLDNNITMEDGTKYSTPGANEQSLEMGIGVRSSWNAGTTVSGKGMLSGVKASFK
jgi:hypothetical protein